MIDYLVEISQKSSDLMKQEFSFLFEAIDQKLKEIKQKSEQQTGESGTDVSIQEDSDDEGEDLMETDDEEEDIESEKIVPSWMMKWKVSKVPRFTEL